MKCYITHCNMDIFAIKIYGGLLRFEVGSVCLCVCNVYTYVNFKKRNFVHAKDNFN